MMNQQSFRGGERICVRTVDDDGFPIVRYGTIGSATSPDSPLVVLFDNHGTSDIFDSSEVERVTITSIELHLSGDALLDDASTRRGLADMWRAEADLAGLAVDAVRRLGDDECGVAESSQRWLLAEFTHNAEPHVVHAAPHPDLPDTVIVRADRVNRWDGFFS